MSLFKRELRQWSPEPPIGPFPGAIFGNSGSGSPSMSSALQVSAVWACVRLVADSVSMMPVHAYTMSNGIRVPMEDPPLLVKPSGDATMAEWVYMQVVSLMLRGNCFGEIVRRDSAQYPLQIELMSPDSVKPCSDPSTGRLVYGVNGRDIAAEDVFHTRAYRMPGSRFGLSPIEYAARQIHTESAISEFAFGYFRDGAHPSSVLESSEEFTQEQARTIKERFMAAVRGREPALLSGGLKYVPIQVSPEESQFLATQKYGVAAIARIFGVPPEMIAAEAGNSMTYANVEQRSLDFLTYTIQPWLSRLESSMSELLPGKKHVKFDTSVLLRTDFETQMKATAIGIASHQMLVDEARALRDLPPFTEAQKKEADLVPMTVSPSGRPLALPGSAPIGLAAPGTTPSSGAPQ